MSDGGPAFPFVVDDDAGEHTTVEWGMSLRDYFASKAIQGILASCPDGIRFQNVADSDRDAWCRFSWEIADAMLKERERKA